MILGVTGTNGSGKGTVVDYLKTKSLVQYSARDFIVEEIRRRGLAINRSAMREVANDLRKKNGAIYIIETLYNRAVAAGHDAVIESVREIAGAKFLKDHGAVLVSVDAEKRARYERIVVRGTATDTVTFEEFCAQEDREMNAPDVWDMNVFGVMEMSDFIIRNDGTLEELYGQVDTMLEQIKK